jgi:predicted nucleic acid-binding protein
MESGPNLVILDTNIVLDTFVFNDPAAQPLKVALQSGALQWIATQPKMATRLAFYRLQASDVLAQFDELVQPVEIAAKAPVVCKDPDDQKFIDLAVTHTALVLSKDNAVLCMKKRLLALQVHVAAAVGEPLEKAGIASK